MANRGCRTVRQHRRPITLIPMTRVGVPADARCSASDPANSHQHFPAVAKLFASANLTRPFPRGAALTLFWLSATLAEVKSIDLGPGTFWNS